MSKYDNISIKDAMTLIATNKYLLPAIQRKFVWEIEQIEMLFDSIMRSYPINSFMLWKITDVNIKQNYKFYYFIKDYVKKFGENNQDASTSFLDEFFAIIDGQQRLNSLYIGLNGSYTSKKPNKKWQENKAKTPMDERFLYLEITEPLKSAIDNDKLYNFKFLTLEEINKNLEINPSHHWFKVGDIIKFADIPALNQFLIEEELVNNSFATSTLVQLFTKVHIENIINYYVVEDQDQDKVLDVFIRTNSGGTKLEFSDLLMSISSANWTKYDAREEIQSVKEQIYSYGNPNFDVTQDFILKALLVLSDGDVSFKIKNFDKASVKNFENNWIEVKNSLIATFELLEKLHFNNILLRAKNAAIPIAYYIYKNKLSDEITKSTYDSADKKNIARWLNMSILKGMFGGTSDSVLSAIREVIKNSKTGCFPTSEIIEKFKTNIDKNYTFDDEIINMLLEEQWGSATCGAVLNLLYPEVVMTYGNSVAEDHMHPKTIFEDRKKLEELGLSETQKSFFVNKKHYNSCLNLQLLETLENESKTDKPLKDWAKQKAKTETDLLVKTGTSLDIMDFEKFIGSRREELFNKLKNIL